MIRDWAMLWSVLAGARFADDRIHGLRRLVRRGCGGWCGEAGAARLVRLEREAGAIGEMGGALVTQTR